MLTILNSHFFGLSTLYTSVMIFSLIFYAFFMHELILITVTEQVGFELPLLKYVKIYEVAVSHLQGRFD